MARDDEPLKGRAGIEEIDRRLGGLLGPLAEGLARLVEAAEKAQAEGGAEGGTREATVQTARGPLKIRTGLSVRLAGAPVRPAAGQGHGSGQGSGHAMGRDPTKPRPPAGRAAAPVQPVAPDPEPVEPPHDVYASDTRFSLAADLPGVDLADVAWRLADGTLTVETPAPRLRRLGVPVPGWVTADRLAVTLVNGVFEIGAERDA